MIELFEDIGIELLVLLFLILLSAFFSMSETAFTSIGRSRIHRLAKQGNSKAVLLEKMKKDPHKALITILIGNNLVNIAASTIAAYLAIQAFGSMGIGIATAMITFVILVFGEITPKSLATRHSLVLAMLIVKPIYYLSVLLTPIIWFLENFTNFFIRLFGGKTSVRTSLTEEELKSAISISEEEGAIEKEERELLHKVFVFGDIRVGEVMTPRNEIVFVKKGQSLEQALKQANEKAYSRIPVVDGSLDKVVGMLYRGDAIRELCSKNFSKPVEEIMKPVLFVPESKRIDHLLREFQGRHVHAAMVVDEFGNLTGFVSLEDLLEELVGEIEDEGDLAHAHFERIDSNTIELETNIELREVKGMLKGLKLPGKDQQSIGKLVLEKMGKIPNRGEEIIIGKARITVLAASRTKIKWLKIEKIY